MTQLYSILGETFANIKIVKAFTIERHERRRFHRNSKEIYRRAMKIARYDSLVHPLTEMMGVSAISLCILCGAYLVLNQETHLFGIKMSDRPLSWGELLLFYGLLVGVTDPLASSPTCSTACSGPRRPRPDLSDARSRAGDSQPRDSPSHCRGIIESWSSAT